MPAGVTGPPEGLVRTAVQDGPAQAPKVEHRRTGQRRRRRPDCDQVRRTKDGISCGHVLGGEVEQAIQRSPTTAIQQRTRQERTWAVPVEGRGPGPPRVLPRRPPASRTSGVRRSAGRRLLEAPTRRTPEQQIERRPTGVAVRETPGLVHQGQGCDASDERLERLVVAGRRFGRPLVWESRARGVSGQSPRACSSQGASRSRRPVRAASRTMRPVTAFARDPAAKAVLATTGRSPVASSDPEQTRLRRPPWSSPS